MALQPVFNDEQLIGRGGFGRVFRVFNKLDDKHYAIKKIIITEGNIKAALHEIRILASIVHPHVIRYYHSWIESKPCEDASSSSEEEEEEDDVIINQGVYYFFNIQMEYCHCSLRQFLWNRQKVDVSECYHIMTQVIDGVYFLHRSGIIHRDMKPDNILIYSKDPFVVKISDFGLAKVFQKKMSLTESTSYTGSSLYSSPEQYEGRPYSFSTDIYSLGVMLMEIQQVFRTESERIHCMRAFKENKTMPTHTRYKDLILEMTRDDATARPSVIQLHHFFNQMIHSPVVMCRDIVWEIIFSIVHSRKN
jgi:serine/threonine protein kinase